MPMKKTAPKSVQWSTVTVYEFGVALGGSAVPRRGGPSIGLARTPQEVWSTTLDKVRRCGDLALTRPGCAATEEKENAGSADRNEQRKPRVQRARRVRWLKPLERITMLTKAGCSEERIYRMMMESSDIAMSRRLCVSMQRQVSA
ncbi:uncharacterized protein PITG_08538 [Phytophthora infestans T30-4]|uniref:Uncharacterized protein n=1 Tax=Phytophthora infestans (strain T30-4) TaxID=403677 RepID=D0NAV2_PHYIT|nr:uncharacterized protein PITG_08538 [Phytophthora infestans T30-4]EEY54960.1 conserved hypothetical protein [Phytophthora infestans T30-4]|eukprot:XP_002903905.1 conserved hypothetical protein [Phytophthora infestans T30-4]